MAVSVVVLMFEVADHHPGFVQVGPVVAVEALLPQAVVERFDVAVVPRRPGGIYDSPTFPSHSRCSASDSCRGVGRNDRRGRDPGLIVGQRRAAARLIGGRRLVGARAR